MRRAHAGLPGIAVGLALLWAGTWAAPTSTADAAGCPNPPLTVAELRGLWKNGGGYVGFWGMANPAGTRCYGRADVSVIGFVDMPDGLGGTSASGITHAWLVDRVVMLYGASNAIRSGRVNDSYTVAVPPRFGDLQARFARRWVQLTAHFDDPAAQACRGYGPKDANPPTRRQAIAACRRIMVLSSISTTNAPETSIVGVRSSPDRSRDDGALLVLATAGLLGGLAWDRRRRTKRT
jgi:hypothetical protein